MWVEDSASIIHDIAGSKKEIDKREGKTNRYRGRKIIYIYDYIYSLFSIISYNNFLYVAIPQSYVCTTYNMYTPSEL